MGPPDPQEQVPYPPQEGAREAPGDSAGKAEGEKCRNGEAAGSSAPLGASPSFRPVCAQSGINKAFLKKSKTKK